jgi:hypothetical protein
MKAIEALADQYSWSSSALAWITATAMSIALFVQAIARYSAANDRINARRVDEKYGLKDRLATYVELRQSSHPFLGPLIHECEQQIDSVSAWKSSRFLDHLIVPFIIVIATAISLVCIPLLPVSAGTLAKKEERKQVAQAAKELEKTVRKLEQKPSTPETKKLLQEFKQVAKELQKPDADRAKAMKRLNALQDQLKNLDQRNQEKLAKDLQNAWDHAQQNAGQNNLSDAEKSELQELAKSFDQAMEGQEPLGGNHAENLKSENFSAKDIRALKEALKKFEAQKTQSAQMRSQLQEALQDAQKGSSGASQKNKFTTDSRLKDRDVDKSKGGVDDGPGTTNQDSGPSHFDTRKKNPGEYMEDRTRAKYDQLYDGQRENVGKDPLYLQNQWNPNGDPGYTNVRNFGVNKDPQLDQLANGLTKQSNNESVIRKERVPPSYQEIVKKYFEND